MEVGWASDSVETIGERYVKQLSSALWYLDPQHGKFHSRSINLPSEFSEFQGFNDWKKIKQTIINSQDLDCHIQNLSGTLS